MASEACYLLIRALVRGKGIGALVDGVELVASESEADACTCSVEGEDRFYDFGREIEEA